MNASERTNEVISDLMDGRLQDQAVAHAMTDVLADEAALRTWQAYHVVRDVLNSPDLAEGAQSADFLQRFRLQLAKEPNLSLTSVPAEVNTPQPSSAEAANSAMFVRRWVVGSAGVMAAAVFVWSVVGRDAAPPQAPVLASVAAPVHEQAKEGVQAASNTAVALARVPVADETRPVMLRDPRLDQLLWAHRQASGVSALQLPTGFLRNATFETQEH